MDDISETIRSSKKLRVVVCCLVGLLLPGGCHSANRWPGLTPPCVLDPGVTQAQLVEHLNKNIIGSPKHGGLVSWRANNAKIHVTGIPLALPANIAVESSRNLRIVVSNPMTRGQEVDIGSNAERFWFWSKDAPGIMTCQHEDVHVAMSHMNLPIQIEPDWLMEIFGVIPINNDEYTMVRSQVGTAELVAARQTPDGKIMERIIVVDTCQGVITEHALKEPGGEIIARAKLDKYFESPSGVLLPMVYQIEWPAAKVSMTINLNNPEANPATLAHNTSLWEVPSIPGVRVVDVGTQARGMMNRVAPVEHRSAEVSPGQATLPSTLDIEAPQPVRNNTTTPENPFIRVTSGPKRDAPLPFPVTLQKPVISFEDEPQSTYSEATWRSSSDRHRPVLE